MLLTVDTVEKGPDIPIECTWDEWCKLCTFDSSSEEYQILEKNLKKRTLEKYDKINEQTK